MPSNFNLGRSFFTWIVVLAIGHLLATLVTAFFWGEQIREFETSFRELELKVQTVSGKIESGEIPDLGELLISMINNNKRPEYKRHQIMLQRASDVTYYCMFSVYMVLQHSLSIFGQMKKRIEELESIVFMDDDEDDDDGDDFPDVDDDGGDKAYSLKPPNLSQSKAKLSQIFSLN